MDQDLGFMLVEQQSCATRTHESSTVSICLLSREWLVGVVNGTPDNMLCLTSFLILHSITCSYVFKHLQVGQSNTMKKHI